MKPRCMFSLGFTSVSRWIAMFTMLFVLSNVYAYHTQTVPFDFMVDGIFYKKNAGNASVTVWYNWDNPYSHQWIDQKVSNSYSGEVTVPANVTYNNVEYTVTAIGEWAFYKCTSLTKVHLPETITDIGAKSFCQSSVTELNIPSGVTTITENTFEGCTALEVFDLPEGIVSLGTEAFMSCKTLNSISLPSSVRSIGDRCFKGNVFTEIELPEGLETISWEAFSDCSQLQSVTLPSTVTSLPGRAFYNCVNLCLNLPASITSAGQEAFYHVPTINVENSESWVRIVLSDRVFGSCWSLSYGLPSSSNFESVHVYQNGNLLTEYSIPDGITAIPDEAFYCCKDMQKLILPSSVKTIGTKAFRQCYNLAGEINLGNVETVGESAFYDCTSLEKVVFGPQLNTLNNYAFTNCESISTVDIADIANWCGVDFGIKGNWFNHYQKPGAYSNPLMYAKVITLNGEELEELVIPSTVTEIKAAAFNGCCRFSDLTIPNSVETIGDYAFIGCADLENIKFGKRPKLTRIGNDAFRKCTSLASVTLPESITSLGSAFYGCSNLTSVGMPHQITEIADYTFYQCSNLSGCEIPDGVTSIGNRAFCECGKLQTITLPGTLKYLGPNAFYLCSGLTGVYISDLAAWCKIAQPEEWQGGGWAVWYNNNNPIEYAHNLYLNGELVTDLVIPDGVEAVAPNAFKGATCIKSVTFPEGCTWVGSCAFAECVNVEEIHIPSSMETFSTESSNNGGPFYGITNVDINVHIKDMEKWISKLSPNFGKRYDNKSYYAHLYLNGQLIEDLVVPESITSLGAVCQGFSLKSVTLPSGLKTVYENAFQYCNRLQTIYSRSKFAPDGSTGIVIRGRNGINPSLTAIYVPAGRANNYKSKWTSNASIIQEAPKDMALNGEQTAESITEAVQAHRSVYGTSASVIDLSGATLGEDVTAETLASMNPDGSTIFFLPEGTEGITGDNIVVGSHASKIILQDGADFAAPIDFTADEVVFARSYEGGAKQTLCLPYNLPTLPEGLKAYTLNGASDNELSFVEATGIIANRPYLVITSQEVDNLNTTNACFKATPIQDDMEDGGCDGFGFYGVLKAMTAEETIEWSGYTLRNDMKWRAVEASDGDVAIKPMSAFLSPDNYYDVLTMSIDGSPVLPVLNFTAERINYCVIEAPSAEVTGGEPDANGEVTIPATVTYDGVEYNVTALASNAFKDMPSLTSVYMLSPTPPVLGRNALQGTTSCIVYVPNGSLTAYETAEGWSDLTLEEIPLPYDEIKVGSLLQTTYCSRFDLDFSDATGIRAYILPSYDTQSGELVAVRLNSVPAGTGVLIKADEAGTYQVKHSKSYTYCLNLLHGTLTATTIGETDGDMVNYVFANGAEGADFYSVVGSRTVSANKAYLQVPAMVAAGVKQMKTRFEDDNETGISSMPDSENLPTEWWTMDGKSLKDKPIQKGLYIYNGKKIIIK